MSTDTDTDTDIGTDQPAVTLNGSPVPVPVPVPVPATTGEDGSGGVGVHLHALTEPQGQHPRVWRERRVAAENALSDLTKRFARKGYAAAVPQERLTRILEDSLRLLTQSMVAEGRLTQEQVQQCLAYWMRLEPNRQERIADPTRPADFGPSPADTETGRARGVLSLSAARARKQQQASAPLAPSPSSSPSVAPSVALRPLVEAYQYVVGEMIAYRVLTDDEAQARLCETQLLYLRPLYKQAKSEAATPTR